MKIGILTFHRATNYGAVLQTYALQTYLQDFAEVEVIDYRCDELERHVNKVSFFNRLCHIKSFVYSLLHKRLLADKRRIFRTFVKKYLKVSNKYNHKTIRLCEPYFDKFIVGSDQVWNPNITGYDDAFVLGFSKEKKKNNSFSASLGSSNPDWEIMDYLKKNIKNFNNISVREKSSKKVVGELCEKEVYDTVDPVFLLDIKKWNRLEKPISKKSRKFIVLYMIHVDQALIDYAKNYASIINADIIYISENLFKVRGVINLVNVSPENLLYLFNNAESIVTNSFHGTAFSIIFNKKFHVRLIGNLPINNRIVDLLSLIGVPSPNDEVLMVESYSKNELDKKIEFSKKYISSVING